MSKFWIVNLFDKVFITATSFLIIFAWINFYLMDLWISFCLGLVFTFSLMFILFHTLDKKKNKKTKSKKYNEDVDKNFLAFKLSSISEKTNLMATILSKNNEIISKNKKLVYNSNGFIHLMLFPDKLILEQADLIEILSNQNLNKVDIIDIVCERQKGTNLNILNKKKINIITKENLYDDYFNLYKTYPDANNLNNEISRVKFKDLVLTMFETSHTKGYFFCGLILIISSFIIPYQPYYIVVGSMLLLFALLTKLLPRFKK